MGCRRYENHHIWRFINAISKLAKVLLKGIYIPVLGVVISCVACYVSLLYGAYSNWNWAQADEIARQSKDNPKWRELLPENSKAALKKWTGGKCTFYAKMMKLGQPCDPRKGFAPIFIIYALLALAFAVAHLVVFVLSVWSL